MGNQTPTRADRRMDRWWWGVLCGAAGSLVTTLAFLIFMVTAGYIHLDLPHTGNGPVTKASLKPIAVHGAPLFVLRGSTTIGDDLGPRLVEDFLTASGYTDVARGVRAADKLDRSDQVVVGKDSSGQQQYVEIAAKGSKTAPPALVDGSADVGMMSSQMDDKQARTLERQFGGDPRRIGGEYVIGLDGVAVIVNRNNGLTQLAIPKIAEAFAVDTDWSQVDPSQHGPIQIERRDNDSGTTQVFNALVMAPRTLSRGEEQPDNKALAAAVAKTPGAIGYVGFGFTKDVRALDVAGAIGARPVPFRDTLIKLELYPLSRRLYLYIPTVNRKAIVDRFASFVATPNQIDPAANAYAISLALTSIDGAEARATAAQIAGDRPEGKAYLDAIGAASRLSADFRFKTDSDMLDARAVADLQRVKDYLAATHLNPAAIKLIAFADPSAENPAAASQRDADFVATQLQALGVLVQLGQVKGLGALPVAPGDQADAKRRNRRVEVWIG